MSTARFPPAVTALLLQCSACLIVFLSLRLLGIQTAIFTFSLLCGLLAAIFARLANLARWWLIIQLLFVPATVAMLALAIPPAFFLAAFLIMVAVYWSTYRTQVPLYLSSNKVWTALEGLLPEAKPDSSFHFIDLGSGLGGVLTHLARVRPDGYYSGIESAPLPFSIGWLRSMGLRNCQMRWGSLWDCNLAEYDVVFAYLSPVPMEKLWRKARDEMLPGTVFISSTFSIPDRMPDEHLTIDDLHKTTLLIWRM